MSSSTGGTPDVLQIEAFDDGLRGKKILQYVGGGTGSVNSLVNRIEADASEPFARKVLITAAPRPAKELFRTQWDVIFNIADTREWILVVTYIMNAPKPILVVCEDGAEFPEVVLKKLAGIAGLTTLCQRGLGVAKSARMYDVVYMPVIDDPGSAAATGVLGHLAGLEPSGGREDRRGWLKELRVAGAGLVWSREGGICWYDPVEKIVRQSGGGGMAAVIADHLQVLADALR
jgi:hypothetical protein